MESEEKSSCTEAKGIFCGIVEINFTIEGEAEPLNLQAMQRLNGWGGWIRTNAWRYQKPLPYRLATPQ